MEMKHINETNEESNQNDPEDQLNNNLNNLADDQASRKKFLPFSMKIKKFKNKYYKRSVYSIIFIIIFAIMTFINFYGFEMLFNFLANKKSHENLAFEVRPRGFEGNPIQVNKQNWEQLFGDVNDFLKDKTPENCRSDDNYYCFLMNETKDSECSKGQSYGLKNGDPCLLINLKPDPKWLTLNETTDARIHLKCDGENNIDKESIGSIQYFPRNGVPLKYFDSNSTSSTPSIFVHLHRPAVGVVFFVECHVFSESKNEMKIFDKQSFKFGVIVDT